MMFNFNFAFFQRDSNQNNTINPKIDVSIKRIEKDFFEGKFNQAMNDLNLLIEDNSSELLKVIKYQLLLLKMSFLLQFRKIHEFKELIELIENKYINELKNDSSTKFQEFKLTLMAFNKNNEFFELSKQLKTDTPNSKPQGHFDIVFYLNSGDLNKAKEIFEEEIKDTIYRKHLLLIGGHIYSNLYEYTENDIEIFNCADMYYKEAIEKDNLSFLDKLQIQGFYATYILNMNTLNKIPKKDLLFNVEDYKKSLDIIIENKEYFNTEYINLTIGNYIQILIYLGLEDDYYTFYENNKERLDIKQYIQYCSIKNIDFEHNKIQECILKDYQLNDLLFYCNFVFTNSKKDIKEIVTFLEQNKEFTYEHSFIMYSYIKGKIFLDDVIEKEIIEYLKINKYNDLETLLSFTEQSYYEKKQILDEDIQKLIELSLADNTMQAKTFDVIKLLSKLGKKKEYIDLALSKQQVFNTIIFDTLKICFEDKDLYFKDFEYFINNIDKKCDYGAIIGNIYVKHDKPEIAFNYFYLEYKVNPNTEIMIVMLQVIWDYYNKSHKVIENNKQQEIFNSLITEKENLTFDNLITILMYSIHILKDTRQILPIINQELLNLDIQNLENNFKIKLSTIYTQTQFGLSNYKDIFLYSTNLCLVDDGKTYIIDNYNILQDNTNNYGFISIDDNEYFLKKQDDKYKEESLFHRITGPFAFRCENPNMINMNLSESYAKLKKIKWKNINLKLTLKDFQYHFEEFCKEPDKISLSELFNFMDNQSNNTKDLFQRYNDNKFQGLYTLANKDYKNYFTLIPYLLNNHNTNFNSLHINFLPNEQKKILTLSSIIFLNEIDKLEEVLKRDDIVIQQTLVSWLKSYSQKIDYTSMPQDFTYLSEKGHKFIPYTDDSIKQADKFKNSILNIISSILKCVIIDDTSENLPIKEAYSHLAPHIGNQEYQALAYCINHNYQIVSENNIFEMLSEMKIVNKVFTTNSIALLRELLEYKDYKKLIIELNKKNYKYLLNEGYTNNLITFMKKYDISKLSDEEKELIKIANSYGLLDKIIQYYHNKFTVLYPKNVLPTISHFDENIDKIFDIIEIN